MLLIVVVVVEGQYFQASLKWFLVGGILLPTRVYQKGEIENLKPQVYSLSSILSQKAASKYPTGTLTDMALFVG